MKIGVSVLLMAALAATTTAQQSSENFARLSMSGPPAMSRATRLQEMEPDHPLHLAIGLNLADRAGLEAFVNTVSNPTSPNYRHFITPNSVGAKFGLPMDTVNKIQGYLLSKGMKVRLVSKNRISILVDATVAQAESAFNTKLSYFSSSEVESRVKGHPLFGFTDKPMVPAELAPYIRTVAGLENFTRPTHQQFVSPGQLRNLYGVAPSYNTGFQGQNRTIAISSFDGFDPNNINLEYPQFSLPIPPGGIKSNVSVEEIDAGNGGQFGPASGEGDLDIQCALNIAPLATLIIYDGGPLDSSNPVGTLTLEADENKADIITESYGWSGTEDFYAVCHDIHSSMSAQGITYMAASGDHGAPGIATTPYPDIDPEVLIVGGTTISTDEAGHRKSETAWNLTFEEGGSTTEWGGGGGWVPDVATGFNKLPAYQKGSGIPTNIPFRLLPDVALDADFSYELFYQDQFQPAQGIAWGGTSASSPTFAGSLADIEQRLISVGAFPQDATGHARFGRIQDLLYTQNGNASVFFDVTSGQIGELPDGTTATAGTNWDFTTGLGVVDFDGLFNLVTNAPKLSALGINPISVEGGTTSSVNGTVTLASLAVQPNVDVALSSSDPSVKVPATADVPLGSKSVNFALTTLSVASPKTVTVTAKYGANTATASITLNPPHASSVSISPLSVVGGVPATATVSIAEGAPSGGTLVTLTSADPAVAKVPATVTIAAGQTKTNFTITTTAVSSNTQVKITAAAGTGSPTGTLTVTAPTLSTLKMSASSFLAGQAAIGTVNLNGVAPTGGVTVAISLSNPSLMTISTPSVTIPAGSATGSFRLTANPVDVSSAETVTATLNSVTKSTSLAINPARLTAVTSSTTSLIGGNNATIGFTLDSPAGPSGISVKVSATPTSAAAFSATTVTIAPGASSATAVLKTSGVSSNTVVTVSGTAVATKSIQITVTAPTMQAFTISPSTIQGNGSNKVTAKITLTGTTGSSPRTINLSSSSGAANFPTSVVVPANASSVTFTFVPSQVFQVNTTATLTATLVNQFLTQTLTITP